MSAKRSKANAILADSGTAAAGKRNVEAEIRSRIAP
jgi:hypothetical protein